MEAVVRRIKYLTKDPKARLLIFSTWTEVLDVLSYALKENQVHYAYAKTAKQIASTVEQLRRPSEELLSHQRIQTLLLPVKQGGNGLNLTGMDLSLCT